MKITKALFGIVAIKRLTIFTQVSWLVMVLLTFGTGCGNSDGNLSLNQSQTVEMVKSLGTYEGPAHAERIMGAMMTGVWTATFFQDDSGVLKCKCTLRLHDEENGWGSPESTTTDVKIYNDSGDGKYSGAYSLRTEGGFSDDEPHWLISIDGISLTSGQALNTISLFDMSANEIKLSRK